MVGGTAPRCLSQDGRVSVTFPSEEIEDADVQVHVFFTFSNKLKMNSIFATLLQISCKHGDNIGRTEFLGCSYSCQNA